MPALLPLPGVAWRDGRWLAETADPWLAIPGGVALTGRWVRLRYDAGLFDEMTRPLLRCRLADGGVRDIPLNGALLGTAEWIGRLPDGLTGLEVSPVREAGAFGFTITSMRRIGRLRLIARGLARQPRMTLTALGARLIGARAEARHCLAFAASGTPLRRFDRWQAVMRRSIDLAGFDAPRTRRADGPMFHIVVRGSDGNDDARLRRTLASLRDQSAVRWQAHVVDRDKPAAPGSPGDIVALVDAGDVLLPHALGHVADRFAACPALRACYGDEEEVLADGTTRPLLKPDFDPVFEGSAGYVGAGAFFRLPDGDAGSPPLLSPGRIADLPRAHVGHIRRLLYRRPSRAFPAAVSPPPIAPVDATIVIPTRDRPALLAACLAGLREATTATRLEVVIVDNGSADPAALALLAEAAATAGTQVIRAPGPFNYAALCNRGAAAGTAPLLVFLNNDVEMRGADWLARLAARAVRPDIGAVGARLLFPDGRLQHGGVVVGLGGTALHLNRLAPPGPGYLGQTDHARTVGAVTGAVLAVERAKFDAVGGFDADAFPVLLNDIDLCLRLAARGWHGCYEPAATLVHAESASRGRSVRPLVQHRHERARFIARWGHVIRDDRWFHPALSLWSIDPALG